MTASPSKQKDTIFEACYRGDEARVSEYVAKGGSVTEVDGNKMTMLHNAVFGEHVRLCHVILKCPAQDATGKAQQCDLDAVDNDGWTPLHFAADRGNAEIVTLLLDEGANINAKDAIQRTPLHLAAVSNRLETVKLLTQRGAARRLRNVAGMTPEECAKACGHTEVGQFLAA